MELRARVNLGRVDTHEPSPLTPAIGEGQHYGIRVPHTQRPWEASGFRPARAIHASRGAQRNEEEEGEEDQTAHVGAPSTGSYRLNVKFAPSLLLMVLSVAARLSSPNHV